jgi:hypothetical protein
MMSMYGFEPRTAVHLDSGDPSDRNAFTLQGRTRLILGAMLAVVSIYGVLHTFDPVALSVVQMFFLLTTVAGVALATLWRE